MASALQHASIRATIALFRHACHTLVPEANVSDTRLSARSPNLLYAWGVCSLSSLPTRPLAWKWSLMSKPPEGEGRASQLTEGPA